MTYDNFPLIDRPCRGLAVYVAIDSPASGILHPENTYRSAWSYNPQGIRFGTLDWAIHQKQRNSSRVLASAGALIWRAVVADCDLWCVDIRGVLARSGRTGRLRFLCPVLPDLRRVGSDFFQTSLC